MSQNVWKLNEDQSIIRCYDRTGAISGNLEWEMQKYPQIQSLKEANLLLGTRRVFGIYQIRDDSPGENYAFMNMSFIESHGMKIKKRRLQAGLCW